jgi:predicted AAA+ superfamily ATPase
MIKREIESSCRALSAQYPVITITGPRQSGKTTLARNLFPQKPYVNLEMPDERRFAIEDPRSFLARFPDGAILDEIQRTPDIPSYLQGIVDDKKQNGLFVLTGSQQFEVSQTISQSLAGRTAMIKLLPLSVGECVGTVPVDDLDTLLQAGFYPGLHMQHIQPEIFYSNYFETYVERDLRQLSQIDDLMVFEKFVRLLAGRAGSLLNYSSIANDCGVSPPTIKKWVSLLEAGYIAFLMPPFFRNIGKRLIKLPKIYFFDVGLLCFLVGIKTKEHLAAHPLRGNIFENFVVMELLKSRYNLAQRSDLYFYRDQAGNEVDVIIDLGNQLIPVEVKSSRTATPDFLKIMHRFQELFPQEVRRGLVIYDGTEEPAVDTFAFVNWANCVTKIRAIESSILPGVR